MGTQVTQKVLSTPRDKLDIDLVKVALYVFMLKIMRKRGAIDPEDVDFG